ncbi:two-component system sensor histidine kinase YesM [Clostridium saccharoperbutylacetonicum]|uniref:Histidine kinase/HAMP domain/histidine kinase-, DNA gyrase B-, and HSP90-like ATPase n=2 Tax=Clostridium saccharoperbutylacetonicum TaxID=36745 RepID=M1MR28_9CLOT|nr:sensor histidine kinase [Clostridium saccharoperbutylacetonicum]AGF58623.1 histidine kinase/HAMP domain/histidine kinase-, DNA gyrase B-, and HSP90-like ATPase [Clostridium saccharoperbutylacetonicum N1-4(HMT)]NRT60598.1 two-component system sensor histidine kinase YesM [Clostridium saccharoperbutylacetonicum]NSB23912.1 two-component system sensor histidine kinase YesM [Clostridium saccharoperbutylacetonicum]
MISLIRIRKRYMDLKISSKIVFIYLILMIFSVTVSSLIYEKIYDDITSKKVSELSVQTLYTIKSNINSMIQNINNNSRIIISNKDIQAILKNSNNRNGIDVQIDMYGYLSSMIDSMNNVSSIYIYDNFGNKYYIDKQSRKSFKLNKVESANWYKAAINEKGYYILRLNAGEKADLNPNENYVSFIRVINDMESQKPIGTLIININESNFVNCYKDIISKNGTNILLMDENNDFIVNPKDVSDFNQINELIRKELIKSDVEEEKNSIIEKIKGEEYIFSSLKIEEYNWIIVSKIPFKELSKESSTVYLMAFVFTIINGILLFIGAISISRLITKPIKKLLKSMKGIENGEFKKVNIEVGNDEIGKLRDGYNIMVYEIEKLINRIIEEQKVKRKAELSVLQAQVKPHFLYNTLDAMGYLALSGKCDEVYDALEALGEYYRTSLSKGREVITVGEEIEIVKNYFLLQKLRYGDIFTDTYEIDERVLNFKILKLVLQPIAENALYHGIKPKGEHGIIKLTVELIENLINISIEDDGVGMTEEELDKVVSDKIDNNNLSFGLRGTIERLRIFYGTSDVYEIKSRKRYGTKVNITIPIEEGWENE